MYTYIIGLNNEFISSGKLHDLSTVHARRCDIVDAPVCKSTNVLAIFDNEEVGSRSKQGAGSPILKDILNRIAFVQGKNIVGEAGIAHTRWATHGEPNTINAHPHFSQSKSISLIHNGIIENSTLLKKLSPLKLFNVLV